MVKILFGSSLISFSLFSMVQDIAIKDLPIDDKSKTQIIAEALKKINEAYIFPDIAKKIEIAINNRLTSSEYTNVTSSSNFAELLSAHLVEASHDKHMKVIFSFDVIPVMQKKRGTSVQEVAQLTATNFGFKRIEILPGNIGYIRFDKFVDLPLASKTAAAAMAFVNNTDALIVDLRQNTGGSAETVAFISSYFFKKRTHLNDIYWRPTNSTTSWYTQRRVPGARYLNKDIYVLVSNKTFSAAEEFAYNLQNLKRATIVGEVTMGGAHPVGHERINEHFVVRVPKGRSINPITETNWEGTGVKPDVVTEEANALELAHKSVLKRELDKTSDERKVEVLNQLMKQKLTNF